MMTAMVAAAALGAVLPAAAQSNPPPLSSAAHKVPDLAAQQYSLQQRIKAGARQGQIMPAEADRALGELNNLHNRIMATRQAHDGQVPEADAIDFSNQIDQLSRSIRWGNQVSAPPRRPKVEIPQSGQLQNSQGLCMQVWGGKAYPGAPIKTNVCGETPNNEWRYESGQLKGLGGMCLQVWGGQAYPGAPLKLNRCENTVNNRWRFEGVQIIGMGGLCVQISGAGNRPGADLKLNRCGAETIANQWHWAE
jgi:outer membrane murein-binding lipoprotein Lpp